ncbi:MAG: sodium-translocating pyrophosphatase [Gemmatimonadales bacterium]|nr:sodium-translocating pyrophosphatase [Gemmatimonadales bacterium]
MASGSLLLLVVALGLLAVVVAVVLARGVLAGDTGTPEMRRISDAIQEGAQAFLSRQNRTIAALAVPLAILLFVLYAFVFSGGHVEGGPPPTTVAIATIVAFLVGATCSGLAGYIGMQVAVRSNIRTASAARTGLDAALTTALRGGAVSGLIVVAMSLLGVTVLYVAFRAMGLATPERVPLYLVGFGFGASFVALFAQLGGGIYTKAADVGADLVGKVEAGIPEDDPRNPAVIADLVGDNVGDCAGRGADLFESTAAENIGAMVLAGSLVAANTAAFPGDSAIGVVLFPLVVCALGIVASIVGIYAVPSAQGKADPMEALNHGFWITAIIASGLFIGASKLLLASPAAPDAWWHFALCGVIGVITSIAFLYITQYYTEGRYRPVTSIANASVTGPATNIIAGLAVAFECTAMPTFAIGLAVILSYWLGQTSGLQNAGLFGTAAATMGMLGTAGYVLAMDTFGPITDNAGGIVEMSEQPKEVRNVTDKLDAMGNTTKALTKGYAVGSAALAAFLLFSAFMDEISVLRPGNPLVSVDIAKPDVWVAGFLGAMLVMWFSAFAISAVSRAAQTVIVEVRRQFQADPGILAGTSRPDYAACVDIVTRGALREMVTPGALAIGMPIAVGLVFKLRGVGPEAVAAFLMVGTIAGILLALFLNNGGGAWDNAKKTIEMGLHGGKGSPAHKAAVVGDTVGDPFKDTAGPSLHVLIKLLATVTLVLAPLFV